MDFEVLKRTMAEDRDIIRHFVEGLSPKQARWKPDSDTWSVLEVANHLADEEAEDFRAALDHILHDPGGPWPTVDPMNWVTERAYNTRALGASLERFLEARGHSLAWLDGLDSPDWSAEVGAPHGPMRAGDVMASWVVHDQWHIQQLVQLRRAYVTMMSAPYEVTYAGTL